MNTNQPPTRFDDLLDRLVEKDGQFHVQVGPDWMQGRTLYGGITAALSLQAVHRTLPDLPPLRSALIAFAGPSSGDVVIQPKLLRQGKSAVFISTDLRTSAGFGVHATFCFGAKRDSVQAQQTIAMPQLPRPDTIERAFAKDRPRPEFTGHFDMRLANGPAPVSGGKVAELCWWLKALDRGGVHDDVALMALADAPPPAALSLYDRFSPISTMTWMLDFMSDDVSSPDGWYAAYLKSEAIAEGYSAQNSYLWSSTGRPLIASRQSVALFG
ncbi:acyl-CoA thioesterase [Candidatus Phycosocius spiralis]|uniref:Acyl-CoA thioesterase n=1 Tax=Candidatus Phycosocius spiralis TaxID=2815099 RepID=A0ABQ4PSU2_9PROT|nr:thioesterase family protein [Candidatus Phycosocius spiralis]GIU66057.1 acyl-CoA thioesterase [Candidatus Phycosocius spiralis]